MHLELEHGSTIFAPNETSNIFTTVTFSISTFGMLLSILALLLLITTACLFREWRKNYKNQLLIQFMIARCAYTFVRYYFDIRIMFNFVSYCKENDCIVYMDKVLMIYTEITLVGWMVVFSRQMYVSLVVVFNPKTLNIWKVSLATWFIPVIFTIIMRALYALQVGKDLIVYFFYLATVKWPALIVNAVILIMILMSLTKSTDTNFNSQANNKKLIVVMNFMLWSFCFQQVFGDVYKLVYIVFNLPTHLLVFLNICTVYHCAATLIFWVLGNANTRSMWKTKLRCATKIPLSPQSSISSTK